MTGLQKRSANTAAAGCRKPCVTFACLGLYAAGCVHGVSALAKQTLSTHLCLCLLHTQVASEAAARLGPAVSALFSAATFLKFERDAAGAISLPLLQQYLARRVANARLVSPEGDVAAS